MEMPRQESSTGRAVETSALDVSVIICTRNRPEQIARAVDSVLANGYPSFELMVVDQSTDTGTEEVLQGYVRAGRCRYLRSATKGLSVARNIGVRHTQGRIVAFTDDDCVAAQDWVAKLAACFCECRAVGAVYGAVVAPPELATAEGQLATFSPPGLQLLTRPAQAPRCGPMGANMTFRRDALLAIGGFDEVLGAGAALHSAEDIDALYRTLHHGYRVLISPEPVVAHYGIRERASGAANRYSDKYSLGNGAYYGKHIRFGDAIAARLYAHELVGPLRWTLGGLAQGRKPVEIRVAVNLLLGLVSAFCLPINTKKRLFVPQKDSSPVPPHP